jgi:hypothetical protein
MGRKVSVVLFWAIILLSVIGLSRSMWNDWRDTLRTGTYAVPVVLFTAWFRSPFPVRKRWSAEVMIGSVMLALVSSLIVVWDLTLYRAGLEVRNGLVEPAVAGAVCIACVCAFIWSLVRLVRRDKLLT